MTMVVNEVLRRNDRIISGSAVVPYDFAITDAADILVLQNGTVLAPPQYSVTGVGADAGGTVILATGPSDGTRITLLGRQPIKQISTYTNEAFPPSRIQNDFNKRAIVEQQLAEEIQRAL